MKYDICLYVRQKKRLFCTLFLFFFFCLSNAPSIDWNTPFHLSAQPFLSAIHPHITKSTFSICFSFFLFYNRGPATSSSNTSDSISSHVIVFLVPDWVTSYEIMPPAFKALLWRNPRQGSSKMKPVWHIPNFPHLHIVNIVSIPLMSMKQILRVLSFLCILCICLLPLGTKKKKKKKEKEKAHRVCYGVPGRRLKGPSWHHFADPPHCLWPREALADRIDAGNERLGWDELK